MKQSKNILTEKEMELVQFLMQDCKSTSDIQSNLKREGDNSGKSRYGYNHKTITSDYGKSEIAVPRGRNGEFEPQVL